MMETPKIHRLGDFKHQEVPEMEYVLDPWLIRPSLAMVAGFRGVGKTLLGMGVAQAIASGGSFLGWKAPKPRKVLYVDGEMDKGEFMDRWRRLGCAFERRRNGGRGLADKNISILTHSDYASGIPDLSDPDGRGRKWLEKAAEGFEVIFLDNLSSTCRSGIENDAESWTIMQEWFVDLRRLGKTVVFLHHTGKPDRETGKSTQRGTSKREDVLNTSILLHPSGQKRDRFQLEFSKTRGFQPPEPFTVHLRIDEDEIWLSDKTKVDQEMIELHSQGLTQQQIARALGVSQSMVSKKLAEAKKAELPENARLLAFLE